MAFKEALLPDSFTSGKEPYSQQGVSKGLSVTIDAHTDQVSVVMNARQTSTCAAASVTRPGPCTCL